MLINVCFLLRYSKCGVPSLAPSLALYIQVPEQDISYVKAFVTCDFKMVIFESAVQMACNRAAGSNVWYRNVRV
jgi:hypothetical protein